MNDQIVIEITAPDPDTEHQVALAIAHLFKSNGFEHVGVPFNRLKQRTDNDSLHNLAIRRVALRTKGTSHETATR